MKRSWLGLFMVMALVLAGCADDSGDDASGEGADSNEEAAQPIEWVEHTPGGDCQCADGSEFSFYSHDADQEKVLLYYQGGGACFSPETCSFTDGTYLSEVVAPGAGAGGEAGIFDIDNPDNPFADWSMVFVPYCTGDVHIGDNVQEYSDDVTVNHLGYDNASKGLDHVVENYADATEVFVAGSSAGAIPSPLFAGLLADELPDASVSVLADASGGYPDNPPVNLAIGTQWGTYDNVPDWDTTEGLAPEDYSLPGLVELAGLHNPDIRMARYDNAFDEVQQGFSRLSGIGDGDVLTVIDANEANAEEAGVPVASFIAPGTDHTILAGDGVYTLEVGGVTFLDWLTRYVNGEDVEDIRCTDCGELGDPEPLIED
jgi:hypothetical protein